MRKLTGLALASTLLLGVIGCGESGDLAEGVPKNVDMTKSYSPNIPVGPIQAQDIAKTKKKDAAAVKADAGKAVPEPK